MNELIFYSILLFFVLGHLVLASLFYRAISKNKELSFQEKNQWRLKALIFPIGYWFLFKKRTSK
ncbi:hypothetical protein [Cyclobacterium amurskyense]|jgi:hypothetical protein|uniref:Uncharacterized protein n=1 Tax=Cyclobacterium amurskyense TaxID=320787 RepID=A0A0H4PE32_9BACT|nr:hypothetical protein [Cyclobacterium amurskyense]AKP51068.1 hypothetical protein CA2015_1633 [Cyclobacterium amurskyense]|tara:strand:+ start:28221 stop:28412 length:192 start_codon:yes stop_codon:yes gene_type:complete